MSRVIACHTVAAISSLRARNVTERVAEVGGGAGARSIDRRRDIGAARLWHTINRSIRRRSARKKSRRSAEISDRCMGGNYCASSAVVHFSSRRPRRIIIDHSRGFLFFYFIRFSLLFLQCAHAVRRSSRARASGGPSLAFGHRCRSTPRVQRFAVVSATTPAAAPSDRRRPFRTTVLSSCPHNNNSSSNSRRSGSTPSRTRPIIHECAPSGRATVGRCEHRRPHLLRHHHER